MLIRITALMVGVIVLSFGISALFDISFVALFAGVFVFLKSFKFTFVLQWLGRFLLISVPKRLLTTAVKLYIIDRDQVQRILDWMGRQQRHWRTYYRARFLTIGIISVLLAIFSAWWIGLWLLVIYEVEVLLEMLWRKIWPALSETIFVKSIGTSYAWLRTTRLGHFVTRADYWFEHQFRKRVESTGETHKRTAKKLLEETLSYQVSTLAAPPPYKVAAHRHLLADEHRTYRSRNRRNHCRHRRPPPRPKH